MSEWKIWQTGERPYFWAATPLDGTAAEREDFFDTREEAVAYANEQDRLWERPSLFRAVRKWIGKR